MHRFTEQRGIADLQLDHGLVVSTVYVYKLRKRPKYVADEASHDICETTLY